MILLIDTAFGLENRGRWCFMRYLAIEESLERIALALESIDVRLANMSDEDIKSELNKGLEKTLSGFKRDFISSENKENLDNYNTCEFNSLKRDNKELIDFLSSRGIEVRSFNTEDETDSLLDNIACFMGDKYSNIEFVYDQMKSNMNLGKTIHINMHNFSQADICASTNLCTQLYSLAFLSDYKYFKSPKYILNARVNKLPHVLNFLSGGWLERYIKFSIEKILIKHRIEYSYLKNPKVTLPNGNEFEFDILFAFAGEVFWFESKTGEYQKHINKYSKIGKETMKLGGDRSFLVLSDINEMLEKDLESVFDITVSSVESFKSKFEEKITSLVNAG